MAVVIGGIIIIWLGLTMGAAGLRWLGVELHYPARLVFVPGTELLPQSWGWPMAGGLVAAAWLINGAVAGLDWHRNRPVKESPATE
jgi:hypothetical protein